MDKATFHKRYDTLRIEEPKTEKQSAFSKATTAENESKSVKPKMSDTFNMKSGFNAVLEGEPEQRADKAPEANI